MPSVVSWRQKEWIRREQEKGGTPISSLDLPHKLHFKLRIAGFDTIEELKAFPYSVILDCCNLRVGSDTATEMLQVLKDKKLAQDALPLGNLSHVCLTYPQLRLKLREIGTHDSWVKRIEEAGVETFLDYFQYRYLYRNRLKQHLAKQVQLSEDPTRYSFQSKASFNNTALIVFQKQLDEVILGFLGKISVDSIQKIQSVFSPDSDRL